MTQFDDVARLMASVGRCQHRWHHVEFLHAQLDWRQATNQGTCMVRCPQDIQNTHAHLIWWPSSLVSYQVWCQWGSPYPLLVWHHPNSYVAGQVCCRWSQLERTVRRARPGCSTKRSEEVFANRCKDPVRTAMLSGRREADRWIANGVPTAEHDCTSACPRLRETMTDPVLSLSRKIDQQARIRQTWKENTSVIWSYALKLEIESRYRILERLAWPGSKIWKDTSRKI